MAHNRISPVQRVTLHNDDVLRTGVEVHVSLRDGQGVLSEPFVAHADLEAGGSTTLRDLAFHLDPAAMNQVEEARPGTMEFRAVHDGEVIGTSASPVAVLAARQWLWRPQGLALELLAAHVMPNAPEITLLLGAASEYARSITSQSQIDGYQSGPDRVDELASAIYAAVVDWGVRYSEPPASWTDQGQKIRTPRDLHETKLGTCLDTTLLFAAALEQAGIRPLVWMLRGHAFVGWWRYEIDSWTSVNSDVAEVINRLELGHIGLVETTLATKRDDKVAFADARAAAELRVRQEPGSIVGVLDIWAARRSQIFPLPAVARLESGAWQTVVYQPAHHSVAPAEAAATERETARAVTAEGKPIPARVQRWKNSLLDLSLRNRLINFSDRGAVRLHVPPARLGDLEDLVNSGRQVQLASSDAYDNVYRHRDGIQRAADLPEAVLGEALTAKASVFTDLSDEVFVQRLRSLAYKARTVEEETGANNLYVTLGTLVWNLEGRELRSPLVLVPVHLKAGSRRAGSYHLILDETGASEPNYCLLEKLRLSFGLSLPTLANPPRDDKGIALDEVIRGVRESLVSSGHPFRVEATAGLGLLQFAKFRLWKDLAENWETLLTAPLAHHLAHTPTEEFRDPVTSDVGDDLEALAATCPIPADGSQVSAVADAMSGRTFVLEGPPGTGKSQTIANLLGRAIAEGRRVLFVAEKRAALDVVARRVQAIGLGDFTLDLHNRDSRPTGVRQQIQKSLDLFVHTDDEGLRASRENVRAATATLSSYARRLHGANGAGLSMYGAETARQALESGPTLSIPPHAVAPGTADQMDELRKLVIHLPNVADAAAPGTSGPWSFCQVDTGIVDVVAVGHASRDISELDQQLRAMGPVAGVADGARTVADLTLLADLLEGGRPPIALLDEVRQPRWEQAVADALRAVSALRSRAEQSLAPALPESLEAPLFEIAQRAQAALRSSWFGRRKRVLAVLDELRAALQPEATIPYKQVPAFLTALLELQTHIRATADALRVIPGLSIAGGWNALRNGELDRVEKEIAWLRWAAATTAPGQGTFVDGVRTFLGQQTQPPVGTSRTLRNLADAFGFVQGALLASDDDVRAWASDTGLLPRWRETATARDVTDPALGSLMRWLAFRRHIAPLRSWGLDAAHREILTGEIPSFEAALAVERGVAEASLTERRRAQSLTAFQDEVHNLAVQRFTEHSAKVRSALVATLASEALDRRSFSSQATSGQIGELRRELNRQRRGLSVRELMATYGRLVTEIMPCVLVSPDSLSRFFPVGAVDFDIVVFDEASQIRVADAIGAIGRARSVVVVGDSKQMPPTSVAEISVPVDDDDTEVEGAVEDEESILSECVQARVHRRWLTWHYRSQDESLIAFSNAHYYEGRLSSFPAPNRGVADAGVQGHGINRVKVDGTFHRSGKGKTLRTNPEEAAAILADIRRRFDAAPAGTMPSIGVVTFNLQQRALIESLIRDSGDARLVAALEATSGDGIFVKNLENVQGDERDVILFSTAFSVNERGVLPLNFGPLNLSGGERRLNVAVTRARRQIVLYSSFEPGQLRADETSSVGIKHLREYLDVAAGAEDELERTSARRLVKDRHRDDIAEQLRGRGLSVRTDVGLSDFRIDLQLARATAPDDPVVAVLLDGPAWAGRLTVNDRDGLPGQVLDQLMGWPAVERVWLPTWLDHPEQVLDHLVERVESATLRPLHQEATPIPVADEPEPPSPAPTLSHQVAAPAPAASTSEKSPAASPLRAAPPASASGTTAGRFRAWRAPASGGVTDLDGLPHNRHARRQVRDLMEECIEAEGPVHRDRLAKAVAHSFGLSRVVPSRMESILATARARPDRHGFFWPTDVTPASYREFRLDPGQQRPIEHISPYELGNAMRDVARRSGGINEAELMKETSELFGFHRLTPRTGNVLDAALLVALETGRLVLDRHLLRARG